MTLLRGCRLLAALVLAASGCRGERLDTEPLASAPVAGMSQSADAALTVDPGSGDLLLSWVGGDERAWAVFFARSTDGGSSWSTSARVAGGPEAPGEVHPHGESSPRLVAGSGGRMALAWPTSVPVAGRKWPATMLRLARSADGGRTWSAPTTLNDDTTGVPVSHQFHGAAWQGDSGLVVAWLDERHVAEMPAAAREAPGGEPDATIYAAVSPDFGGRWAPNVRLWGAACPCCRVSLARGPTGTVTAAWRQHFPGSIRDVVIAPVEAEPRAPARVHEDEWAYPGCPHTGPAVAVTAPGVVHTAWYSGKPGASGVFYRQLGSAGDSAGPLVPVLEADHVPTVHAAVVPLANGGALVAYDVGPGGGRVVRVARISPSGRRLADATVAGRRAAPSLSSHWCRRASRCSPTR
ncbi:MAG: exo-alpha-sialidase [Gemmatimonadales bacterium]